MDSQSLSNMMKTMSDKLDDFYDEFAKERKAFLEAAAKDPLRAENDKLRRDLKASDDENDFMRRDLDECRETIKNLEAELKSKNDILSAIGGYVRQDPSSERKRERSPEPNIERERKRSRDELAAHSPSGFHGYRNGDVRGYERSTPSSGYVSSDPYRRDSHAPPPTHGAPYSTATSYSNGTPYSNGSSHASYPPTYPPAVPGGYESHSQPGISIAGASQYANTQRLIPNSGRPRRLVCHSCYSQRVKCDNGITCRNCQISGVECVRTLCQAYQSDQGCYRTTGDCFKIHDEQGYTTVEYDPFNNNPKPT